MRYSGLLIFLIGGLTVVYPIIVYTSLSTLGPGWLSLALLALLIARVLVRGEFRQPEQYAQLLIVGALCLLAAWRQSETILRYYPVAMSLGFSLFFAISLKAEMTLVERFARIFVQDIEPHQRNYMRGLTVLWSLLLLLNAAIAAYTACCLSLAQWTLYNGLIAYLVLALFTIAELINRHFYKKRYARRQQSSNSS